MSDSALTAQHILHDIKTKNSRFWQIVGRKRALSLFHEAARRVPAYKDFLKKHRIRSEKVKTWEEFEHIPPISKKSYLQKYPLEALCWDGHIKKPLVLTATSGSTGASFYFPRTEQLDWEYSILAELFLNNSSYRTGGPVLVIIGFGMGIWIGGLITYKAFELMSQRGYPVSIITPGINKPEIFHALKILSPHFRETIIAGYPPFLKDVLDEAVEMKIPLKKLQIRLLSAAEAYTEKFRDYMVKKAGVKNMFLDVLNIYGTADIGAMAWETPATILLRRLALGKTKLFNAFFSPIQKTPTLAQYNPYFINFEAPHGDITLTGNNAIPLIRYEVGDHGGVWNFDDAAEVFHEHGVDLKAEAKRAGMAHTFYQLPMVYLYERSDFSVVLSGANVYPEEVRGALQHDAFEKWLTTKFTIQVKNDRKYNEYLEINIELRKNIAKNDQRLRKLEAAVRQEIISTLLKKNSEYDAIYTGLRDRAIPKIIFWPYGHPLYFKAGVKQKWVRKN